MSVLGFSLACISVGVLTPILAIKNANKLLNGFIHAMDRDRDGKIHYEGWRLPWSKS